MAQLDRGRVPARPSLMGRAASTFPVSAGRYLCHQQDLFDQIERPIEFFSRDDQGWGEPETTLTVLLLRTALSRDGVTKRRTPPDSGLSSKPMGSPRPRTSTAYALDLPQPPRQVLALLLGVVDQAFRRHCPQGFACNSRAQRVATEGRIAVTGVRRSQRTPVRR